MGSCDSGATAGRQRLRASRPSAGIERSYANESWESNGDIKLKRLPRKRRITRQLGPPIGYFGNQQGRPDRFQGKEGEHEIDAPAYGEGRDAPGNRRC